MADSNVNSFTSNPLNGGSSTGGNIIGSNSNTFDDTSTSYQGRSSSTGGGLGQSPWGRLTEVLGDDANLGTLFSGVGGESGGGNPFANNPAAAEVLFGGDSQGGSPFSNLRSNIDKLVGNQTSGSSSFGGGGSSFGGGSSSFGGASISAQSPGDSTSTVGGGGSGNPFAAGDAFDIPSADSFDLASYGIPSDDSFGGDITGDSSSLDFGGAFGGATSEIGVRSYIDTLVNSKLSEGGISSSFGDSIQFPGGGSIPTDSFGTVSDETFSAIFGIPSASNFDFAKYGIPTDGSFGSGGGAIPIEGDSIGDGIPIGGGIPSFGGGGSGGFPTA